MKRGLEFGFIGLGQCGGNIVDEFAKLEYTVVAINTSDTDLELLKSMHKNNKLLITRDGIQGAGKNPQIGREALEDNIESVYKLITDVFDRKRYKKIFICVGLGGGTGSGTVDTLAEILIEQGYEVGIIATLPSNIESPRVQLISLSTFEKITEIEGITTIFLIDNQKAASRIPKLGINTKYKILNSRIAKQLNDINEMSTKASLMAFDAKDLDTVLSFRGLSVINQISIDNVDDLKNSITLSKLLNDAIETSLCPEFNELQAAAAVFLFELPKGTAKLINETAIETMKNGIGNPFDVFYGLYEKDNTKNKKMGTLTILATGIDTNSIKRVDEIENSIDENKDRFSEILEKQKSTYKSKSSELLEQFSFKKSTGAESQHQGDGKPSTLEKLKNKKRVNSK